MRKRRILGKLAPALAAALLGLPAAAQANARHYSIEFSCGSVAADAAAIPAPVVPGDYATTISALNDQGRPIGLEASVVLTLPGGLASDTIRTRIRPGQARLIDCDDILRGAFTFPTRLPDVRFFKGFVVVKSQNALAISAHYTATGQGEVSSQVVQVEGRRAFFLTRRPSGRSDVVCHIPPGNPGNRHTIEVDPGSVPAHLGHGDHQGECDR